MSRIIEAEALAEAVPHEFLILSPVPKSICTKQIKKDKTVSHRVAKNFKFQTQKFETPDELFDQLEKLQQAPYCFIVRGHPTKSVDMSCDVRRIVRKDGDGTIAPTMRRWVTLDIDGLPSGKKAKILASAFDPRDPESTIRDIIDLLPSVFHDVSCHWRYSSSAGFKGDTVSCHLTFVMDVPVSDEDLKRYFQTFNESFMGVYGRRLVDPALFNPIQPHYTAAPIITDVEDPMTKRSGIFKGASDVVNVSREWVVPDDDAPDDRRYMTFLGRVGDDKDGFHHPIMQGIASWINFHGEPEVNARTEIKRLVRSYIDDAEVAKDRGTSEVERYRSDDFLDGLIDGAINKGFARGTKSKVDISELLKTYIYVSFEESFYHPGKDLNFAPSAIKNAHASMAPGKSISKLLLESPDLKMVDTCEFVPGIEEQMSMYKGRRIFNTWQPRRILPSKDETDASVFTDHLRFLVDGDDGGYHHLASCIAHVLANPGRRLRHAVVIGSLKEGTGKSYLKQVFRGIIGNDHVMEVGTDQLKEQYNDWLCKSEIVFIEELMAGGRLEIANRMKPMITEDHVTIRKMRTDSYVSNNPASFFATTNHSNAIILDKGSRRFWVWMSEADPKPPAYYKELFGWTKDNLSTIYRWAIDFDLSDFDPEAPPPKTKHFEDMVDETARPLDAYILECTQNKEWPIVSDLVNTTDLAAALNTAPGFRGLNPIALSQTLKRLGFQNLGAKRLHGKQVKMWAVRDYLKWITAGDAEVSSHYKQPSMFEERNLDF
tara:strand:- start:6030 stop:8342 length:2313 start_codon:yes stop_codon:yes gene_type:complete